MAGAEDASPSEPATSSWRVAVIDRFYEPVIDDQQEQERQRVLYGLLDLDNDELPEPYYHGDLVQMIASHPSFIFLRYPIRDSSQPLKAILTQLARIKTGFARFPVDALILSWESSTLISAFEKPLKRENVKHYKALIREWGHSHSVWYYSRQIIHNIEWLTERGVRVFTIAGNGGSGMVNTFSFASGVITVGASEPELSHFIANNVFVDHFANAVYEPIRVDNNQGQPRGYDLNNDACIDIPVNRLSSYYSSDVQLSRKPWPILKGSSFAAPAAMKASFIKHSQICQSDDSA
ncbi:hypothetical protein H4O21_08925 [Oceanospirillum sp. D5]|uniref:Peptidase S8/S53 domain-containing protein n=1 Tax=Oceanospirillum sediminis TaxID=2760088 RepID=A0A839IPV3_9GAMM|nr:hypothetical protein [Oceanospirillum sediminis]